MSIPPAMSVTIPAEALPRHVAFIMDGNGRWATKRGFGRLRGHAAGTETVKTIVEHLAELGVPAATFYAFSTENWKRPLEEVSGLFDLMRLWFKKELREIMEKGVRVRFIGNRTDGRVAPDIIKLMQDVEQKTADNKRITAVFAINYSGRDELLRAVTQLTSQGLGATPENLSACLDTAGLPDPDLIIRTSGEQRISNFLLWQLAYSEFYFTETAWPDFTPAHLNEALQSFASRQRRFGQTPQQAKSSPLPDTSAA